MRRSYKNRSLKFLTIGVLMLSVFIVVGINTQPVSAETNHFHYYDDFQNKDFMDPVNTNASGWGHGGPLMIPTEKPEVVGDYHGIDFLWDVYIDGDYAYLASDYHGLEVLDISNPENPVYINTYYTMHNTKDVFVQGDHAYVLSSGGYFEIVDCQDPWSGLSQKSNLILPVGSGHEGGSVFVAGDYAYVTFTFEDLYIINVTYPWNPQLLCSYNTGGDAYEVVVQGKYAFIADGSGGFLVLEVSNPSQPKFENRFDTNEDCYSVFVHGCYAFLAAGSDGLVILEICDLPNIYHRSNCYTDEARSVFVDGDCCYILSNSYDGLSLIIIDIHEINWPHPVTKVELPGSAEDIFISGTHAYIASYNQGLYVVQVAKYSGLEFCGSYWMSGSEFAEGVFVEGEYAFLAYGSSGLQIIDIRDPYNPMKISDHGVSGGYASSVFVSGFYAFVAAESSGLQIIDVSSPWSPWWVDDYIPPGNVSDVFVSGTYAYIANEMRLTIVNISSLWNPPFWDTTYLGNCSVGSWISSVFVSGDIALVTKGSELKVIDVLNPYSPYIISSFSHPLGYSLEDVFIEGDYAYVAAYGPGVGELLVIDISNPISPFMATSISFGNGATSVYVSENLAFVTDDSKGLCVINVTNPTSPGWIEEFPIWDSYSDDVFCQGEFAYLASLEDGLKVFKALENTGNFFSCGVAQSIDIFNGSSDEKVIGANINPWEDIPPEISPDVSINYFLSVDNGTTWEEVKPWEYHSFENPGYSLLWKAILKTDNTKVSPLLRDISVDYDVENSKDDDGGGGPFDGLFGDSDVGMYAAIGVSVGMAAYLARALSRAIRRGKGGPWDDEWDDDLFRF